MARTSDNRPICFACGIPGHVARLCRRRLPPTSVVLRVPAYESQAHPVPDSSGPTGNSYPPGDPSFLGHHSPSPRRCSVSPMRPHMNPAAEGN